MSEFSLSKKWNFNLFEVKFSIFAHGVTFLSMEVWLSLINAKENHSEGITEKHLRTHCNVTSVENKKPFCKSSQWCQLIVNCKWLNFRIAYISLHNCIYPYIIYFCLFKVLFPYLCRKEFWKLAEMIFKLTIYAKEVGQHQS